MLRLFSQKICATHTAITSHARWWVTPALHSPRNEMHTLQDVCSGYILKCCLCKQPSPAACFSENHLDYRVQIFCHENQDSTVWLLKIKLQVKVVSVCTKTILSCHQDNTSWRFCISFWVKCTPGVTHHLGCWGTGGEDFWDALWGEASELLHDMKCTECCLEAWNGHPNRSEWMLKVQSPTRNTQQAQECSCLVHTKQRPFELSASWMNRSWHICGGGDEESCCFAGLLLGVLFLSSQPGCDRSKKEWPTRSGSSPVSLNMSDQIYEIGPTRFRFWWCLRCIQHTRFGAGGVGGGPYFIYIIEH